MYAFVCLNPPLYLMCFSMIRLSPVADAAGTGKDGGEGDVDKSAAGQEAGASSSNDDNDGEWSDDDNENDSEGGDRPTPKRARTAAP